ncbi:MAG: hypothetical protein WCG48_01995 [Candidatus Berkelbacteria bacterium]
MALPKNELKKLETEIAALRATFDKTREKVRKTGGDKIQLWAFRLNSRIHEIENKINDLKAGNIRVNIISPEDEEIEKKIAQIETRLGIEKDKYL